MFNIDFSLLIIMRACKLTSPPQWQCRHVWSRVPTLKTSELATALEVNLIFSYHVISIGQGVIWLLPATATKVPALFQWVALLKTQEYVCVRLERNKRDGEGRHTNTGVGTPTLSCTSILQGTVI